MQLDTHIRSHDQGKVVTILKKVLTDFSLKKITWAQVSLN